MILSQKKTNWKFLIIIIILSTMVTGGIFWWQKEIERQVRNLEAEFAGSSPPTIGSITETSSLMDENWKTYHNDLYGFEFKCPDHVDEGYLNFYLSNNPTTDFYDDFFQTSYLGIVSVGGEEAKEYQIIKEKSGPDSVINCDGYLVKIPVGGETLSIFFEDECSGITKTSISSGSKRKFLDQIISTFKFIDEKVATSAGSQEGWVKYENNKYGFGVDYPLSNRVISNDIEEETVNTKSEKIVSFIENGYSGEFDNGVIIYADKSAGGVENCLFNSNGEKLEKIKSINGIDFYGEENIEDFAMAGQSWLRNNYVFIHENTCYRITSTVHWVSIETRSAIQDFSITDQQIQEEAADISAQQQINDQIVSTFKFLDD
jgi:hypothetical protein